MANSFAALARKADSSHKDRTSESQRIGIYTTRATTDSQLVYFHLLHPLRDLHVPAQLVAHDVTQLR